MGIANQNFSEIYSNQNDFMESELNETKEILYDADANNDILDVPELSQENIEKLNINDNLHKNISY